MAKALIMSVIIADAGPLIALARIHQLGLLRDLFGKVSITETVHNEILPSLEHADKATIEQALSAGWLMVVEVDLSGWRPLYSGVDAGESSAICLASQSADALLIIDDRAGRAEAKAREISLMGTAAVIGLAKLQGLIPAARPLLFEMRNSGYYLSDIVIQTVLTDIGE